MRRPLRIAMLLCRTRKQLVQDTRVLREARRLAGDGHHVTIYVSAPGASATTRGSVDTGVATCEVATDATPLGVEPGRLAVSSTLRRWATNARWWYQYRRNTAAAVAADEPDAIHCHDLPTLAPGVFVSERHSCAVVYDSHEIFTESMAFTGCAGSLKRPFYVREERRLVGRVSRVITVSASCANYLANLHGIPRPTVVENVPECRVPDAVDRSGVRRSLGVADSDRLLVYQGLIAPGRGSETIVDALRLLPDAFKLLVLGEGPSAGKLRQRAEDLGVTGRLLLHGMVPPERLLECVGAADAGVVPIEPRCLSYRYSLPNKVFECLAAGVPFVASDLPELRQLAIDEDLGLVFKPGCASDLARVVRLLLDDGPGLVRRRANALRAWRERYNWNVIGEKLSGVYREIVPVLKRGSPAA